MACIAKYYPTEWYCNAPHLNPIDYFLVQHSKSCWENDPKADHGGGTNMFGFRTENDEDGFMSDYRDRENHKLEVLEKEK